MPAYADTYATSTNNGPVILNIDGVNEESCDIEYTMELDTENDLNRDALNVVADIREESELTNDRQIDNLMAVDVHTVCIAHGFQTHSYQTTHRKLSHPAYSLSTQTSLYLN